MINKIVKINVTSITSSGGITTINVPETTIFENDVNYCLFIFTTIPSGTNGTQINITNGTNTYTVYNKLANYWRPCCGLNNRKYLTVRFLNDPNHFLKIN